ncbi:MAG: hypothetical protein EXS46_00030 [Candidatus Taylorbacteria bacterium]|nr:hypothetical protein [Candidatus Taylorbacteria bacterium]
MKDFKQNSRFGGAGRGGDRGNDRGGDRGGFRGGNSFGKRDFGGPKEMFDAVCAKCNKGCQVPFRPNGKKPVYCLDCFGDSKPQGQDNNFDRPARPDFQRREFNAPQVSRPDNNGEIAEIKRQLVSMNIKLDRLLQKSDTPMKAETVSQPKEMVCEVNPKVAEVPKKASSSKKATSKKK